MKKVKTLPVLILMSALYRLVTAVMIYGGNSSFARTSSTAYYDPYRFEVAKYDIVYEINEDSSIKVTEDLTISYLGYDSTGFIRDIPVNGGVQIKNVDVKKIVNGATSDVWYDVYFEDSDFLSVDIGDSSNKYNKSERYLLTYDYCITNKIVNSGTLPINPVGHGWNNPLKDITITLMLPDGYLSSKCYVGSLYSDIEYNDYTVTQNSDGNTVIKAAFDGLDGAGVTFYLTFEDGAIKSYSDFTPYLFLIPAFILLAAVILLKLFVFNKNKLMPVVNYEAPDKMDPLMMGKLIDNKVDGEDVTSLIYYWASKGYIKINLDDKNDPVLIRIMQQLPASAPDYERLVYDNLFASGDAVRPSQLKNKFYIVVENAAAIVNKRTKGLYNNKSIIISFVFAVLGGLLLGLAPLILSFTGISSKLLYYPAMIMIVPALMINLFTLGLMYNRLKLNRSKLMLSVCGIALLIFIMGLIYTLIVPSSIIGVGVKVSLYIVSALICLCSVLLINRTKEYNDKLNDIIGFKNFIQLAEKRELEMMLEQDPQFYYHILPYAQVLGVTDKWEEKFADLTVEPPKWLTGNVVTTYFEFRILSSMLRSSMSSISRNMVSRPSSSGVNGGGRGFGGGGFSGGGFGGGGGRGR